LTGGCDEFNNFYRRVLLFEKYEKYKITASMIRNRSLHTSIFCKRRNELYTIGGNQGGNVMTINAVECLDVTGNVFSDRAPMHVKREGAGACIFETSM
jgi:hypothetical protein